MKISDEGRSNAAHWYSEAKRLEAEVTRLTAERDALKLQAQSHAMEARTANATIAEIYRLCTGSTGEPGNWSGAEPVRKLVAELSAAKAEAEELRTFRNWILADAISMELDNGEISHIIPAKADIRGPTLKAAIDAAIATEQGEKP